MSLVDDILGCTSLHRRELCTDIHDRCARLRGSAIPREEFLAAVALLVSRGSLDRTHDRLRRCEPDCREYQLYEPLKASVHSVEFLRQLKVDPERSVFQQTATGGALNTGMFSKPDFTLATIRRFKFDPLQHLDVITFEVKNREGTNMMAVHEALAHARFAHYSYLVCPESELDPASNDAIRNACAEHGIGLVTFMLESISPEVEIGQLKLTLEATRRSTDPHRVEQFLENRLDESNRNRLLQLAQST